ncbi:hypothetical protein Tco_0893834 [Tanacetum coccineum]|uniref:Uncharacterized protein n=1 Tax=Tanacetum coccineum TaxID=301880 RepID=A0ABQ5CCV0_9ASTR
MAESILNKNMEKAQTESNLSITSNNINIELGKDFLEELQKNAYHGWIDEDVMDHIAKVLEMIDLIYIPVIMKYMVKLYEKARILELKRRYFEDYCSDNQYAVSIKEDTAYLCLHSPKGHKGNKINTPYPEKTNTPYWKYSM